jgi:hypothetical protein
MFDDDARGGSDPRERDDDARDRDPVDPRDDALAVASTAFVAAAFAAGCS